MMSISKEELFAVVLAATIAALAEFVILRRLGVK